MIVVPKTMPIVAVMVAVDGATPVTRPVLLTTVATAKFEEVQTDSAVRS